MTSKRKLHLDIDSVVTGIDSSPRHLPQSPENFNRNHLQVDSILNSNRTSQAISMKDNKEQIVSEIDIDSESNKFTDSSKEHIRASISSFVNQSKHLKIKLKNEKNFKDLNNSLANLASRRVLGRSSSDNDAITYIKEMPKPSMFNFEIQPIQPTSPATSLQTPVLHSKFGKNYHTSIKKEIEATPTSYYQNRKTSRFHHRSNMESYHKEIGFSEVDYGKFQKAPKTQNPRSQNLSNNGISKPLKTEGEYWGASTGRSDRGKTLYHLKTEAFEPDDVVYDNSEIFRKRTQGMKLDYNTADRSQVLDSGSKRGLEESKEGTPIYTPSFKNFPKGVYKYQEQDLILRLEEYQKRTTKHGEESDRKDTVPETEQFEKLQLNSISDGVEYKNGGVGTSNRKKKVTMSKNRNGYSSQDFGGLKGHKKKSSSKSGAQLTERPKVDGWKKDLIKIKTEIEKRRNDHDELDRLVTRMVEGESPMTSRHQLPLIEFNDEDNSAHSVHISNIEHTSGTPTPTLGSPMNILQPGSQAFEKPKKESTKKISFDFRNTDLNDENVHRTITDPIKMKTKDFTNETLEGNNSFIIQNGVQIPVEKPPCCGSMSNCNIF